MTDVARTAGAPPAEAVPIEINGVALEARKGELVIDAAERNGVYIPRFCYHPRMKPVGMCRMCIVEVDTGRGPALQPSCMLEATPGMKVDTASRTTKKAQDGVLEFLLINHPLDCPVCDKGGECPLQDQTMAYGPGESRFVEEKRHKEKPIPLSDLVLLDRERCILCDRCTRFASEVAGDPLIHFINRGGDTEINTFPDEPFSSYFSGNTVQICPVGALTATPYRFKARPWDLAQRESTCQSCAVGCRIAVQSSQNQLVRYLGVDVDPVNWGWLCDRGRFDHEYVNSPDRLRGPLVRDTGGAGAGGPGGLVGATWSAALRTAAGAIAEAVDSRGPASVAVIGGARLTNEDAYAWAKLAKGVIGTDNVDAQLADGLPAELVLGLPQATIDEVCTPGGTVILAAADLKEELPVLFLRLRHAVVNDGVTVIELTPQHTGVSELAAVTVLHRPGEVAVAARALLAGAPEADDHALDGGLVAVARDLLQAATGPVSVVIGRQSVAESDEFIADAASALRSGLPDARFLPAVRRANVRGALELGLTPGFLPGRTTLDAGRPIYEKRWPGVPAQRGLDTAGILSAAAAGGIEVLVLLGADPLVDFPDAELARRAVDAVPTVVSVDLFLTESTQAADVVLPAAGFGEKDGTTTNVEGRISLLRQKVTAPGTARPDWMIAAELAGLLGADLRLESVEQIWDEIVALAPAHRGLRRPDRGESVSGDGVIVPLPTGRRGAQRPPSADDKSDAVVDSSSAAGTSEGVDPQLTVSSEGATPENQDPEVTGRSAGQAGPVHPLRDPAIFTYEPGGPVGLAPNDAYGLRLVVSRKLYDLGTTVQQSPSLAKLAPGSVLRVNAYDFDKLGVASGQAVRVKSSKGALTTEVVRDIGLPRGSATVHANQPGIAISELLDITQRVTHVRLDSRPSGGGAAGAAGTDAVPTDDQASGS
jgi:NADH-quinone oxidoreductase subunit G